jgi:hypothetical protein
MNVIEKPNFLRTTRMLTAIICFFIFLLFTGRVMAVPFDKPIHLSIVWEPGSDYPGLDSEVLKKEWPLICRELGMQFLNPAHILGMGVISEFDCDKNPPKSKVISNHILLTIADSGNSFNISLSDLSSGVAIKSSLSLSSSNKSILAFRNIRFRNLVISYVFDTMPMAMRLTAKNYKASENTIFWSSTAKVENAKEIVLPKKVYLYRLIWNERFKMWQSKILGEASSLKVDISKKRQLLNQQSEGEDHLDVRWSLPPDTKLIFADGEAIWIHNQNGPGRLEKELKSQMEVEIKTVNAEEMDELLSEQNILTKILTAPFASAHLGARFGLPLLAGASFASKTTFVGVIGEVRAGPLNGLRLIADIWPKVTENFDGQDGEFGGSRYIVGWSFRYALPSSWFVNSIDICPAIGQWSFKIDVPVESGGKTYLSRFNAQNALSFGLGIGLEWASGSYLTRLWYSQDLGLSLGDVVDSSNVVTKRLGADTMYRILVFKVGKTLLTTSALGFIGLDSINMERTTTPVASDKPEIAVIDYFQIYGGGGLSISW